MGKLKIEMDKEKKSSVFGAVVGELGDDLILEVPANVVKELNLKESDVVDVTLLENIKSEKTEDFEFIRGKSELSGINADYVVRTICPHCGNLKESILTSDCVFGMSVLRVTCLKCREIFIVSAQYTIKKI